MISKDKIDFSGLKKAISKEKKIIEEMTSLTKSLEKTENLEERNMITSQVMSLKDSLKKINEDIPKTLDKISLIKPLPKIQEQKKIPVKQEEPEPSQLYQKPIEESPRSLRKPPRLKHETISKLEKLTLKRLKKKRKKVIKKRKEKPSKYIELANKLFSGGSKSLARESIFRTLKRDLIKANLQFTLSSYISVILFTTLISIIIGACAFLFFLFFNIEATPWFISMVDDDISARFLKVFWLLFAVPITTFLVMYFYPSLEKKSAESKINQELPFATIHMSAISNSMIEPGEIFRIIISTGEYPYITREFIKLMNEVTIYGYDLVSALRNSAFNCPSTKLKELFNGLATTITSGGDLPEFFNKRAESLLFEHRLEREKNTRTAETFMDIYISVVIAAPMILMLLLIMMKIGGLGVGLSVSMITLIMVLGVGMINILFMTLLYLKQPGES